MASERMDRAIFEEDHVSIFDGNVYKCGLVLESAEYQSSEDEDENEEDELFERVTKGTVRVAWHPDGTEEVIHEDNLVLEDRSVMPGDVVCHIHKGKDSQRGYATNVTVLCHLHVIGTDYVIKDIDSKLLQPLESWPGDCVDVYLDSWVGKLDGFSEEIHLQLPDGTVFKIEDNEHWAWFDEVYEKREMDSEFYNSIFHEGQLLKCSQKHLATLIKREHPHYKWPDKNKERQYVCKVVKVDLKKMDVHWLCRGYAQAESIGSLNTPPPRKLKPEHIANLRNLDCFAACSVQIGDKARYKVHPDNVIEKIDSHSKPIMHYVKKGYLEVNGACASSESEQNMKNLNQNLLNVSNNELVKHSSFTCDIANHGVGDAPQETNIHQNDHGLLSANGQDMKYESKKSETKPVVRSPANKSTVEVCSNKDKPARPDSADTKNKLAVKSKNDKQNARKQRDKNATEDSGSESVFVFEDSIGETLENSSLMQDSDTKNEDSETGSELDLSFDDSGLIRSVLKERNDLEMKTCNAEVVGEIPVLKKPEPGDTVAVEVIYTYSFIDIMWQDGSRLSEVKSVELFPIHHLDELEFFPGDYVIPAAADDINLYAVVESVQHTERTCVVRWMKPYSIGSGTSPDMNIASEEVSVYDIKDHPDFKFRPGHVVVRVGGYENGGCESQAAAGQICELGTDGRVLIHWADGNKSHCFPQEIYLIDNELSELNESVDSSDEYDTDNSSGSWITDEEIEEDVEDSENEMNKFSVLCVEASQKLDLDQTMDKALSGLCELEEGFSKTLINKQEEAQVLEELLRVHQQCKFLDRMLKTAYFRDHKLVLVIQVVRALLDKVREDRMVKKARDLYIANTGLGDNTAETCATKDTGSAGDSDVSNPESVDPDSQDQQSMENEPSYIEDKKLLKLLHDFLTLDDEAKQLLESGLLKPSAEKSSEASSEALGTTSKQPEASGTVEASSGTTAPSADSRWWVQYLGEKPLPPVVLLSRIASRLLRTQLSKVRTDLNLKWDELMKSGKLKILENIDDEEDSDDIGSSVDKDCSEIDDGSSVDPVMYTNTDRTPTRPTMKLDLASDDTTFAMMKSPITPQTPADIRSKIDFNTEGFIVEDEAATSHRFFYSEHEPNDVKAFTIAVRKELKMLQTGLPQGIFVKGFSDRMDLYTVMMYGPCNTPYQDGLFFFEIQLPNEYPHSPPRVHYLSFCTDRLNPNLYENGKVCVSLLGTWTGRGTEVWTSKSSLLQVLISIQGLILVPEPYYNEAGYEKQRGSQQGVENSRMYNEMAIIKMVESMMLMSSNPPGVFINETREYLNTHSFRLLHRLEDWIDLAASPGGNIAPCDDHQTAINTSNLPVNNEDETSASVANRESDNSQTPVMDTQMASKVMSDTTAGPSHNADDATNRPSFPLFPLSRGFQITLRKLLTRYKDALNKNGYRESS